MNWLFYYNNVAYESRNNVNAQDLGIHVLNIFTRISHSQLPNEKSDDPDYTRWGQPYSEASEI